MSTSSSFFTTFRTVSSTHRRKFFVFFCSLSVVTGRYFNNISSSSHPSTTETHYVVPPLIDPVRNVQGHIPCYRPCRDDGIRLEVEQIEEGSSKKIIFHNYGHGGSGWSTGFGTVKYVLEELFDREYFLNLGSRNQISVQDPIAVIGAGVIGCYTAIGLLQRGFKNVTVFAESDQDLTSHKAAGLVGVFKAGCSGDEEKSKRLDKVAIDTFRYYAEDVLGEKQAERKAMLLPPSDSVRRLPRYMGDSTLSCDAEMFVTAGLMQPSRKVQVVFVDPNDKTSTQNKKIPMFMFPDALFVDVQKIMEWLHNTLFEEKRVKKVITTIERDRDILAHSSSSSVLKDYRYIFNCTGCGSKELFLDKTLHRNGGHLLELCNQGPNRNAKRELNYVLDCLLIAESVQHDIPGDVNNKKRTCEQYLYYIPKGEGGVLGGTLVYDMEEGEPFNPHEFERILKSANEMFYGK